MVSNLNSTNINKAKPQNVKKVKENKEGKDTERDRESENDDYRPYQEY
jgi:hypothetical protein